MQRTLLGRRRFLAGLVALGAIHSSAFAQTKPGCGMYNRHPEPNINTSRGGIYRPSTYSQSYEEFAAEVRAARAEGASFINTSMIAGTLEIQEVKRAGSVSQSALLRVTETDPTLYRLPTGMHGVLRFDPDDVSSKIELVSGGRGLRGTLPENQRFFGRLTGPVVALLYSANNKDMASPDLVFTFASPDLNRAWGHAQETMQAAHNRQQSGQCTPQPYPAGVGCFLTTATVEAIGLEDDCWELTALRNFRDGWLANQPGGQADIARYYANAPQIADALRADPRRLAQIYFTGILPSALAAKVGLNRIARSIYSRQMRRLGEQAGITA